ncbi:Cna B-type domain-containing protein [Enterococcus sp. LJL99]
MNKKNIFLSILFVFLFSGSFMQAEASEKETAQEFPLIYGVHKGKALKDGTTVDPEVELKDFSNLNDLKQLYIIQDENDHEYFCMRRYISYPQGNSTYFVNGKPAWVDPNDMTINAGSLPDIEKKNKAAIAWLIENYYESMNQTKPSTLDVFEKATMETKYAATQLVIWRYTNPRTMLSDSYARTINNNEITKQLLETAEQQKETNVVDYEELYKKIEEAKINIEPIETQGTDKDNYLYSAVVNGQNIDDSIMVNVDQDSFGLTFGWIPHGQTIEQDITNEVEYTITKNETGANQLAVINFKVPKKYIESTEKGTLTMKGNAQIESKQSYILYYQSYNGYQPIGYYGKMKKHLTDYRKLDLGDLTAFKAQKEWDDNNDQDGMRPKQIYVALYQNDVLYSSDNPKVLNKENNWTATWGGLPIKDSKGNIYKYTAKELFDGPDNEKIETLNGYETETDYPDEDDGTIVIFKNSHIPERTKLNGQKMWDDNNNQDGKRPDKITVHLLADGKIIQSQQVNALGDWSYEFNDLPVYKDGKKIEYTVTEEAVPEYETSIDGTTITNHYKPEVTELKGNKKWDDENNQDGKRPKEITVNLLANGEKVATKKVTEKDNWSYEFTNLPIYKDGKKIDYTVTEETVPEYETSIDGTTITNRYKPEVTELKGNKKWDDGNNQDGKRPEEITVNLLANGEKVASKKVTEKDNWSYEFTNLPVYKDGKKIDYTVVEEAVPEYETSIDGTTITNHYKPEITELKGNKKWDDGNNQDGKRPEEITVNLLANGEKVASKKVTEKDNWSYEFTNLPVYKDGKKIEYTVTEEKVPEYETSIDGTTITNHYKPEVTELKGNKKWDDGNNQDGKRPEEITVNLLANGEKVASKKVTEKDNWSYEFTNLPVYKDGKKIEYTVTEEKVPEYETSIDGTTITNHYKPQKTSITVIKRWKDNDDKEGVRPEDIQVQLYAKGNKHGEPVTLNEANHWTYTWNDLDVAENGVVIIYSVDELTNNPNYETTIDDSDMHNIIITNTKKQTPPKPNEPDEPNQPNDSTPSVQKPVTGNLLNTGEKVSKWLPIIGGILFLSVIISIVIRKKQGKESK